jgi:hypothetical protein
MNQTMEMNVHCFVRKIIFILFELFSFKLQRIKGGLLNQDEGFVLLGFQEAVVSISHGAVLCR